MIFTTKMKHVLVFVLEDDAEKVTKELINLGLLHFINIREIKGKWQNRVNSVVPDISHTRILEVKKRLESFFSLLDYNPVKKKEIDIQNFEQIDLDEVEKTLNKLSDRLQGLRDRQQDIQHEILKLQDIKRQVDLFGDIRAGINVSSKYSFLDIQAGSVPSSRTEELKMAMKSMPQVILQFASEEGRTNMLVITMKKDSDKVQKILDKCGWLDSEIQEEMDGVKDDVIDKLEAKIVHLTKEQKNLEQESRGMIENMRDTLVEIWTKLSLNELYIKVQSFFSKTERTILFTGWLPTGKKDILKQAIDRVTAGSCYFEWSDPFEIERKEKVNSDTPVLYKTPRFLRPFKMLVDNYAIPEYGSIDPTPFVGVAYLCMFGLMFGDVGQGIVLAFVGIFGLLLLKNKSENVRNLMRLIVFCGFSAIIFGILFGSYFGIQLFKPLWFDFHGIVAGHRDQRHLIHDIYGILKLTINFGITVISVGLLINWINLISKRRWFKLFMDKGGILGSWIYFAGVYLCYNYFTNNFKLPGSTALFFLIGLPILLLIIKPPFEYILKNKHNPNKKITPIVLFGFFMAWFIEVLEIVSGYLSNTLSFMRVAGLGIAHASLMISFFEIAKYINGGVLVINIWTILILVIGNIVVIFLEGLSAGIQSLRLNYYEFFSKYFTGTGKAYSPVSLRNR